MKSNWIVVIIIISAAIININEQVTEQNVIQFP
jgi:hypothetical protein